jgi:hypothetical protein
MLDILEFAMACHGSALLWLKDMKPRPYIRRAPLGKLSASTEFYGSSRRCDHEHRAFFAQHFIIQVNADDGVSAYVAGFSGEFGQGSLAGIAQGIFIGARTATDDITDASEQIFENVSADDAFARYNAKIFADGLAFNGRGGGHQHGSTPSYNSIIIPSLVILKQVQDDESFLQLRQTKR